MKICKFCGAESPDYAAVCPSCGSHEFKNRCGNCGTVFEEGTFCPRCGVKFGTAPKRCPNCGNTYFTVACPYCGFCGYNNNTVNNYAYYVNTPPVQPVAPQPTAQPVQKKKAKKKHTWLWILGWICMFPVPVTILMVRNKDLPKGLKRFIIALAWIIFLTIMSSGDKSSTEKPAKDISQPVILETTAVDSLTAVANAQSDSLNVLVETEIPPTPTPTKENAIENLVNTFNASSVYKLEYVEDFAVQNTDSGHYRVEFRLMAFKNAVGKSYKLGDQIVDIISYGHYINYLRIYANRVTFDQCKDLIQYTSKILDPKMTDEELSEAIAYISSGIRGSFYYGYLGLTFTGTDDLGYDLMITR